MKLNKHSKIFVMIIMIGIAHLLLLEEAVTVGLKKNEMETNIVAANNLLKNDVDFLDVEEFLTKEAKDIGFDNVSIQIKEDESHDGFVIIEILATMEANTIGRKLFNKESLEINSKNIVPVFRY